MTAAPRILAVLGFLASTTLSALGAPVITSEEWQSYRDNFIGPEGRVIDKANGDISHSESQGYGLLLAVLAEDRAAFDLILEFTNSELRIREDGLAAWRWEPQASPHVTDSNNATDGDMLIAYAMIRAGEQWQDPALISAGTEMIRTVGRTMLVEADGMPAILPGEFGFLEEEADNVPVLNPSYWIFESFPLFTRVDPVIDWMAVSETGLELLSRAAETEAGIPSDWAQLVDGGIRPSPNVPAEFGYNGIRIPLYLMRAGQDPAYLEPFRRQFAERGLATVDVVENVQLDPIAEPGYQLITAAMECVSAGTPIPAELQRMEPTSYYAATLQLLMLDYLRREHTACLDAGGAT
ncbi:glycosyl hydrolase family 8 [Devosia sediminis]|uniref:Glucanase n=1 Tax=Devosia sediminis TaxID=2798801 RepID=A0A934J066_9HYPH|nr:glycosyl hydrolase family 8 [Devosia sediminis]MBJ3786476.1 endoglucanase [Devosia sediminis]